MRLQIPRISLSLCLALCGCGTEPDYSSSVEVKGGMTENTYADLIVEGDVFRRFEGKTLNVRIGGPTPDFYPRERTSYGRVKVAQGSFRIAFPASREAGLYKSFALYFDVNGDGKCTPEKDEGSNGATGAGRDSYVYNVENWMIFLMDANTCEFMDGPWMD